MNSQTQIRLGVLALICCSFFLVSCGASKAPSDGSSDLSSRGNPSGGGSGGGDTSSGILAECNAFNNSTLDMTAHLTTYYNPSNGNLVLDYINMRIVNFPDNVLSDANLYLNIFRWSEDRPGSRFTNPTPVDMYFVRRGTGQWLNTNEPVKTLSRSSIQNLISKYSLGGQSITPANFFENFNVILTGMDITYDAIVIGFYDVTKGSSAYASVEALLPAFQADPNLYARTHPSIALQQLHPMYERRRSGMSEAEYKAETDKYCF